MSTGSERDWPYFARWHYRSHHLPLVRFVTLLWHGDDPIGICVFAAPARSLNQRSRYFGLPGGWTRSRLQALNEQLVTLSRVVLHPTYRGAGLAAAFVRASCQHCRWPWVEALAEMGHLNPFFERASFQRVGVTTSRPRSRREHSNIYGVGRGQEGRSQLVSEETYRKSLHASPIYYIYDNRRRGDGDNIASTETASATHAPHG